jgi:hypothetical protein
MQLELGSELRGPAPYETPHLTPHLTPYLTPSASWSQGAHPVGCAFRVAGDHHRLGSIESSKSRRPAGYRAGSLVARLSLDAAELALASISWQRFMIWSKSMASSSSMPDSSISA